METTKLRNGDKIIWDSGFGYEFGYFLKEHSGIDNDCLIKLVTGSFQGELTSERYLVKPYSKELVSKLHQKYGYLLTFPKK